MDPTSKLIISLVQTHERDQDAANRLLADFAVRTQRAVPRLLTTDEHAAYKTAILTVYGLDHRPRRRRKVGRKRKLIKVCPPGLTYATVHKTRQRGRVVEVEARLVLGKPDGLTTALAASETSQQVNTSFVERLNGTARHFNARKRRKTYAFSKQMTEHEAMSWLMVTHYNFCWLHRMLRVPLGDRRYRRRSPAMAAGLTDHVWTVAEWLRRPVLQQVG